MRALLSFVLLAATATATAAPNDCAELGWVCPDPPACGDRTRRCDVCLIPEDTGTGRQECFCAQRKCVMEYLYLGMCDCVRKPDCAKAHDEAWCEARGYVCPPEHCNECLWPGADHIICRCAKRLPYLQIEDCTCVDKWERQRLRQRQQERATLT
jgi:hypothetical protein